MFAIYAQCIQPLPLAEERMVIFTLPSLPELHAQTTWIIISALNSSEKLIAWKKLNAFHYSRLFIRIALQIRLTR